MATVRYILPFIAILNPAVLTGQSVDWTNEMRKVETEQIEFWRSNHSKAASKTEDEKLDFLSKGLRNMGQRSRWQECNPEVIRIYNGIQSQMLSVSGYADYFENRIISGQNNQSAPIEGSFYRGYEETRYAILGEILPYLPSPETISVYGRFLSDEAEVTKEPKYPVPQANCDLAINGLRKIGLRGFPNTGRTMRWDDNHMQDLEMWRSWWGKVKSGKLAFSFEGQNVEYRFKPDGTWIEGPHGTTSPKDRATHSMGGALRSEKLERTKAGAIEETSPDVPAGADPLPRLAALLILLIGGGFFIFRIRTRLGSHKSSE